MKTCTNISATTRLVMTTAKAVSHGWSVKARVFGLDSSMYREINPDGPMVDR